MLAIAQLTKPANGCTGSGWGIHLSGRKWCILCCAEVARENPGRCDARPGGTVYGWALCGGVD